jgi:RHH-type transcriptional regulator, proline utilization regulon repressor / proline dehydrogenase / delta 1-pyrroline-5-carboxylate dehydrogenase
VSDSLTPRERTILNKGLSIFAGMESDTASLFNKDWWYGRIMDWSMKNEKFKVQMFRFVDVLPYLQSSQEVTRHLKEYFSDGEESLPSVFGFGLGLGSLAPGLLAGAVKKNVEQMARMFITGESPATALTALRKARKNKICFTADLLGEATLSESEALDYQRRYLELIEALAKDARSWSPEPQIDTDELGPIPKVNVSVKVTSLYSQIDPAAWQQSLDKCKERIRPILQIAKSNDVFINLDMEQYAFKGFTLELFKSLAMEPEFRNWRSMGVVIQAYLRDSLKDVEDLVNFAKQRGTPFTVRLVKGAYWDFETIHAGQNNWPNPVYTVKRESDANFEDCTVKLLDGYPHIRVAVGSHNVRSVSAALVAAEERGVPLSAVEVQMLYGMADPIKKSLVKMGVRVREYATIGELIPGMAYLVRRLLENTSNESFLRSKFAENISPETLLRNPKDQLPPPAPLQTDESEFRNQPPLDFGQALVREKFEAALKDVQRNLGKVVWPTVGKHQLKGTSVMERYAPAHPNLLVAKVHMAGIAEADQAVALAKASSSAWRNRSGQDRAALIDRLADLMTAERYRLAAIEVFEVGKTWYEADGDITEAIDFCRYYAGQWRKLCEPRAAGHAPGEKSLYIYEPRGVVVVIAPWNFPLAILTGMVAGALVTGNTVIMKPAEQSPLIANELYRLAMQAGIPPEVLSHLPGQGEIVGAHLVEHPDVSLIAFTGSRAVGLNILKSAANLKPGQRVLKKCIIEMGGKNAIIIDSDADLDEAVEGVLYSAFGYSGQKCSACSRVIVLEEIFDRFTDRLKEAARSIRVGLPEDPVSFMGPVVDEESCRRIKSTIELAQTESKLIHQGDIPAIGCFVPPTIFAEVNPKSALAQEEVFGPVLAVIRARDLAHALQIANDTDYGLTGGLFSRSPANIAKVKAAFEVGNLYINRGNTGALVERHPFGGIKMSGVGSKTGGPDYLQQFVEPKVITENTMRRGFAPT